MSLAYELTTFGYLFSVESSDADVFATGVRVVFLFSRVSVCGSQSLGVTLELVAAGGVLFKSMFVFFIEPRPVCWLGVPS